MRIFVASLLLLVGCKCPEQPILEPPKPDKQRDAYIDKLEAEAGEGAAALAVAKDKLTGLGLPLVNLTIERLSGIKQPTKPMLDKYAKALADAKALKAEEEKAAAVDNDTSILFDQIVEKDKENAELRVAIDKMNRANAFAELRNKFLMIASVFAFVGGVALVASFYLGKGRLGALALIGCSVLFGAIPFVIQDAIDSPIFPYAFWGAIALASAYGAYAMQTHHADIKERLKPRENPSA